MRNQLSNIIVTCLKNICTFLANLFALCSVNNISLYNISPPSIFGITLETRKIAFREKSAPLPMKMEMHYRCTTRYYAQRISIDNDTEDGKAWKREAWINPRKATACTVEILLQIKSRTLGQVYLSCLRVFHDTISILDKWKISPRTK